MIGPARRLLMLTSVVLLLAGCAKPSSTATTLDPARVTSLRARIMHAPDDGPLVEWFESAPDDVPRLIALLGDGVAEPVAATNFLQFAEMEIATTDAKVTFVQLFWTGSPRGAYRVNGRPFRGSTDKAIRETITECAKRGKKL